MDIRTSYAIRTHNHEITQLVNSIELLSDNGSAIRHYAAKIRQHNKAIADILEGKSIDVA